MTRRDWTDPGIDTRPYFLADLMDPAAGTPHGEDEVTVRRGLLADVAGHLHADVILIAVVLGMVLTVLTMAAGTWLVGHSDLAWIAQHPVIGGGQ